MMRPSNKVSSNDELVNQLIRSNIIRSAQVERAQRAVDRNKYICKAYVMRSWRRGPRPAVLIYAVVLEGLELKSGLSFLNIGSGTGYLSTMAGLILGSSGINHGVEVEPSLVAYANKLLKQFIESSPILDEIDFCDTKFYIGNGLCLSREQALYDRLYCGAECSTEQLDYFKRLIRIGGVLVLPVDKVMVQFKRTSEDEWTSKNLISVVFAELKLPTIDEAANPFEIEISRDPQRLKILCYWQVRERLRTSLRAKQRTLPEPLTRRPPFNDTDVDALLRLIIKRRQNSRRTDCGTVVNPSLASTTSRKATGKKSGTRLRKYYCISHEDFKVLVQNRNLHNVSVETSKDDEHPSGSIDDTEKSKRKSLLLDTVSEGIEQTDSSEKLGSGIDDVQATSSELNVQCSKEEQIDGSASSVRVQDDVELGSTPVQEVVGNLPPSPHTTKPSDDINEHNDVADIDSP